jgi:HEAT repeat protein
VRKAREIAVAALAQPSAAARRIAVAYLAVGASNGSYLRGQISLDRVRNDPEDDEIFLYNGNQPIVLTPPKDIKPEMIRPLLKDPDEEVAAYAGYLLAMTGDREGVAPVIRYWREREKRWSLWQRLAYRSVAAVGDDSMTPLLEEIYGSFDANDYSKREFYWTVKSLKGANAMKFIERIKGDVEKYLR